MVQEILMKVIKTGTTIVLNYRVSITVNKFNIYSFEKNILSAFSFADYYKLLRDELHGHRSQSYDQ